MANGLPQSIFVNWAKFVLIVALLFASTLVIESYSMNCIHFGVLRALSTRTSLHAVSKSIPVVLHKQMTQNKISIDIVYEDEHMLAVNKPANMLSVPGVKSRNVFYEPKVEPIPGSTKMRYNPKFVPRTEKFKNAIRCAYDRSKTISAAQETPAETSEPGAATTMTSERYTRAHDIFHKILSENREMPRQKRKFASYLNRRPFDCQDNVVVDYMWDLIAAEDFALLDKEKDMGASTYEHCVTDILGLFILKIIFVYILNLSLLIYFLVLVSLLFRTNFWKAYLSHPST